MSIDELKTIIALSGNKRLPDLEEEIFSDTEATMLYLSAIDADKRKCTQPSLIPMFARHYAMYVIGSYWPVAEHLIVKDRHEWEFYHTYINENQLRYRG